MAIKIPSTLVEFILLGPLDDRRQLQESPILGDVWVEFGNNPDKSVDLLIAPYRGYKAGDVATEIELALDDDYTTQTAHDPSNIAFLQGLIVARLTFKELMQFVAPKTKWWINRKETAPPAKTRKGRKPALPTIIGHEAKTLTAAELKRTLRKILFSACRWHQKTGNINFPDLPSWQRFLALIALIHWAGSYTASTVEKEESLRSLDERIRHVLKHAIANRHSICRSLVQLIDEMYETLKSSKFENARVWQVSLNRSAMPAISRSVPAVKADAATYLFKVNCKDITWAVIDSGIDGDHPAFKERDGIKSRVRKSYDFKNFRRIVSISNRRPNVRAANIAVLMKDNNILCRPIKKGVAERDLKRLAEDAANRGAVHWELIEKYVEIKPATKPPTNHGTHVAGILGACKEAIQTALRELSENPDFADGMCPDISLYDFRVLGGDIKDAEFAIIAALQFIRYLNSKDNFLEIHGANMSLSIPHDVRNFACGRTPICDEAEKLVSSGVVVVAAAGNHGYKSFETMDGSHDSYTAFSITDPGNADNILTVGATHRFWPHTYGVSFFSSRGPTGDGRMKPDLVAPGEKIRAPLPGDHANGGAWGDLDGTSMAAPHVSGAAAMLMARYSELVGQPARIKRILCESATDLGRERSFQGRGMLDVLRAFQSI